MKRYRGTGVYGAIAVGNIFLFRRREVSAKRVCVSDAEAEKKRIAEAKARSIEQLREIYDKVLKEEGEANARIFEIHMMMIEDAAYNEHIENLIETRQVNAEYAVAATSDDFAERFAGMDDEYLQARVADIRDISKRILQNLSLGAAGGTEICPEGGVCPGKMIVCADDLAPSETVLLDKDKIIAFVTAHGSSNSHTAILARNRNIPAVIGVGEEFLAQVENGMTAIVDGFTGEIFVEPDEETYVCLVRKQTENIQKKKLLLELKGRENITLDGRRIDIFANIGGVDDIGAALLGDAGGIGLFRSEFQTIPRWNSNSQRIERSWRAWAERRLLSAHWISARTSRPVTLTWKRKKIRRWAAGQLESASPVPRFLRCS